MYDPPAYSPSFYRGTRAGKGEKDRVICISLLPRAAVFATILGQVKKNRIGSCVNDPLPRATVFAGVLGQEKKKRIRSYV